MWAWIIQMLYKKAMCSMGYLRQGGWAGMSCRYIKCMSNLLYFQLCLTLKSTWKKYQVQACPGSSVIRHFTLLFSKKKKNEIFLLVFVFVFLLHVFLRPDMKWLVCVINQSRSRAGSRGRHTEPEHTQKSFTSIVSQPSVNKRIHTIYKEEPRMCWKTASPRHIGTAPFVTD